MFLHSSSVTTATVLIVTMCAIDIVHALMEATNETVVSVHKSLAAAEMAAQCCSIRIFIVGWGTSF